MSTSRFAPRPWWPTPFVGLLGGWLASLVHWPLPWITGALIAVTLCRCLGWRITTIPHGRPAGQWLIATAIGLHFTPAILTEVVRHLPLMALAAIATLVLALVGITVVQRLGTEPKTAFFAFMPANFAEMINLAERHGADAPKVAAAHTLRLVIIVLVVPPAMLWGVPGIAQAAHVPPPPDWRWLAPLLAAGLVAALAWKRRGWPNPWMFGPLALCCLVTASSGLVTSLPPTLSHLAQVLIGVTLGCHFDRAFFRRSPRFLLLATLYTLLCLIATFLIAWLLAQVFALPFTTLALGMTPGSTTEMYLTAEALGLGVGTVTAMQILRLVVVMAVAEPLYRRWCARSVEPVTRESP